MIVNEISLVIQNKNSLARKLTAGACVLHIFYLSSSFLFHVYLQRKRKINIRRNKKEEGEDRRLPTVETRCCCPIWIPGTKSCVLQDESLVGIGNKGKKPILAHRRSLDIKSLFILCWDKFSGIQFVSFPIFNGTEDLHHEKWNSNNQETARDLVSKPFSMRNQELER